MRKIIVLTVAVLAAAAPSMAQTAKRAPKIDQAAVDAYIAGHPGSNMDDYQDALRFCTAYRQLALTYIARKAAKRPEAEVQRAARLETIKYAPDGDYEKQQTVESALLGLVQKIYEGDPIKDKNAFAADAYSVCMDKGGYLL